VLYTPVGGAAEVLIKAAFASTSTTLRGFGNLRDLLIHFRNISTVPERGPQQNVVTVRFFNASNHRPDDLTFNVGFYEDPAYLSRRHKGYGVFKPLPDSMTQRSSIAYCQLALARAHLDNVRRLKGSSERAYSIATRRIPEGPYPLDAPSERGMMPLRIGMGFAVPFCILVGRLVDETQNGMREKLRLVGLKNGVYWLGHFLAAMVTGVLSCVSVIVYMLAITNHKGRETQSFLSDIDVLVPSICFLIFCGQYITNAMLVSLFFSDPSAAVVFALLYWLSAFLVPWYTLEDLLKGRSAHYILLGSPTKLITSVLPCMGLHWCFRIMGCANLVGEHYSLGSVATPVLELDNVTMLDIWMVMLAWIAFVCLLIWYFGNVLPWVVGVPLVPWYPFTLRYWFPGRQGAFTFIPPKLPDGVHFEPYKTDAEGAVFVNRLDADRSQRAVLHDTNFKAFTGEIMTILGPNGSGKTTLLNIMSGNLVPSGGQVIVNGYDMHVQTARARSELCMVKQTDVLFADLTVQEHLRFFGYIGGLSSDALRARIVEVEGLFKLSDVSGVTSLWLTKVQKRQLDLAIAMVTCPKVLLLDEPAIGMDAVSRVTVWEELIRIKKDTCIIIGTTDVDEVEALSDRVAILGYGGHKCYGTLAFIRRRYGSGYNVRIQKGPKFQAKLLMSTVKQKVPDAYVLQSHTDFIILGLGERTGYAPIATVLREFELNGQRLGIASFRVSVITMEDIFMRVVLEMDTGAVEAGKSAAMSRSIRRQRELKQTAAAELIDQSEDNLVIATEKITGISHIMEEQYESSVQIEAHVKAMCDLRAGRPNNRQIFLALLQKRRSYMLQYMALPVTCWIVPTVLLFVLCKTEESSRRQLEVNLAADALPHNLHFVHPEGDIFLEHDKKSTAAAGEFRLYVKPEGHNLKEISNFSGFFEELKTKRALDDRYLIGAQFSAGQTDESKGKAVAWYDGDVYHTQSVSLTAVSTALLRLVSGDSKATLLSVQKPLRHSYTIITSRRLSSINVTTELAALLSGRTILLVLLPLAMSVNVAAFVLFPIDDRVSNSKKMQLISGVSPLLYWLSNYTWDMMMGLVSIACMFIPVLFCHSTFASTAPIVLGLYIVYVHCSLPFVYFFSFVADSMTTGFVVVNAIWTFAGILTAMAYQIFLINTEQGTELLKDQMPWDPYLILLYPLPPFSGNWALAKMVQLAAENEYCTESSVSELYDICAHLKNSADSGAVLLTGLRYCCATFFALDQKAVLTLSPLSFHRDSMLFELLVMIIEGTILLELLVLFEKGTMRGWWATKRGTQGTTQAPPVMSPDVAEEKAAVEKVIEGQDLTKPALLVIDLKKTTGSKEVLRGVTFAVEPGDCFGVMGLKGCGKTTMLDVLAGLSPASGGTALIGGVDLTTVAAWRERIGLCPSHDSVLGRLTVRQTLVLYANIRGITRKNADVLLDNLIDLLNLRLVIDDTIDKCSTVTRRKLAVGIAIIGLPPVVLLDDPATGLDMMAKRKIYRTILLIRQLVKSAVLVATHSVGDCVIMSEKMAVMFNGQFQCIGNIKLLRARLCRGFVLLVRLRPDAPRTRATMQTIESTTKKTFPRATFVGRLGTEVEFDLEVSEPWSEIVRKIHELRQQLEPLSQNCLVSEVTLEHALLKLAKFQAPKRTVIGC
ncbi:unnamed protein product, partial [Ixodes pacificus]